MRPRTVLILAAVVLGLGAYLWLFELDRPPSGARQEAARRLFPWEPGAVTAVEVSGSEGGRWRLELQAPAAGGAGVEAFEARGAAHWRLVAPLVATADSRAVEDLVGALVELRWYREEAGVDAAALGLEPPRFRVVVEAAGEQRAVRFGNALPASDRVVVARDPTGSSREGPTTAYVVDDLLVQQFQRPADDWRARDLLPGNRYQVEAVHLAAVSPAGVPPRALQRQGAGEIFDISGGALAAPDRADAVRVGELLGELETLRVVTFLDGGDPVALGLAPAAATVTVRFKGQTAPFLLELGDPTPDGDGVYGRSGDTVFTLRTGLLPLVRLPAVAWRSLRLTSLEPFGLAGITVEDDLGTVVLHRTDGVWTRDGEAIGGTAPADLVDLLTEARGTRLLSAGDAAELPTATLTLRLEATAEGGGEAQRLHFHPWTGIPAGVAVRSAGRGVVLLWDEAAYGDLTARIQTLRQARPLAADAGG